MSEEEQTPPATPKPEPKDDTSKAKSFLAEWKAEQALEQAKITAKEEELKVKELEIQKRQEELENQERKDLLGKLGVADEEDAKKYLEKPLEVLRELVEYRQHIKIGGGGIPKKAIQPVAEEIIKTSDGLQIRQKLRRPDGTWVEL